MSSSQTKSRESGGKKKTFLGYKAKQSHYSPERVNSTEDHRSGKFSSQSATLVNDEINEIDRLRREFKYVECISCGSTEEWRIFLRHCGHVLCIKCALEWLEHCIDKLSKARIKCPKEGCVRRIHENDINALLELNNDQLDDYMTQERRAELQQKHDISAVGYALGDFNTSIQCPACRTLYMKESGCNYVQCANQSCSTWFCSCCAEAIDSIGHFGKISKCRLGPTDLYRASYLFRMLFETSIFGVVLLLPAIIYASLVLFPISMFIIFTYKCTKHLTARFKPLISILLKFLIVLPVAIFGLLVTILCILIGFAFIILYIAFAVIHLMPTVMTIKMLMKMLPKIAIIFGINSISDLLSDAQEAKLLLQIEAKQLEQEKSELVEEEQMTKSQAFENRIRLEDHGTHLIF